ncbi:hypothetical protein, partial [Thermogladius sp.]|uniref:hypothetical protein n=1 Tax=Thermogladius sp. TaxID=2023064 RepID=UPI003D09C190
KCPEGSITAYFDLDTVYNNSFHKVVEVTEAHQPVYAINTLAGKREHILSRGGWRDLMCGEDKEFWVRVGFSVAIPVMVGLNAEPALIDYAREKRYAKNVVSYVSRVVRSDIDYYRALGLNPAELLVYKRKRYTLIFPFYTPYVLIKGSYRYIKTVSNNVALEVSVVSKMVNPREHGIDDSLFFVGVSQETLERLRDPGEVDVVVKGKVGRVIKITREPTYYRVIYIKTRESSAMQCFSLKVLGL